MHSERDDRNIINVTFLINVFTVIGMTALRNVIHPMNVYRISLIGMVIINELVLRLN